MSVAVQEDRDYMGAIDVTLSLDGKAPIDVGLDVYAKWHPYSYGGSSPDEPAHFELLRVMLGKVDVSGDLPDDALEQIERWCRETA